MIRRPAVALATLVTLAATAAGAADLNTRRSAAAACRPDAQRLCADVQPGGGRIRQCLVDHADALSPSCRQVVAAASARESGGAR